LPRASISLLDFFNHRNSTGSLLIHVMSHSFNQKNSFRFYGSYFCYPVYRREYNDGIVNLSRLTAVIGLLFFCIVPVCCWFSLDDFWKKSRRIIQHNNNRNSTKHFINYTYICRIIRPKTFRSSSDTLSVNWKLVIINYDNACLLLAHIEIIPNCMTIQDSFRPFSLTQCWMAHCARSVKQTE